MQEAMSGSQQKAALRSSPCQIHALCGYLVWELTIIVLHLVAPRGGVVAHDLGRIERLVIAPVHRYPPANGRIPLGQRSACGYPSRDVILGLVPKLQYQTPEDRPGLHLRHGAEHSVYAAFELVLEFCAL